MYGNVDILNKLPLNTSIIDFSSENELNKSINCDYDCESCTEDNYLNCDSFSQKSKWINKSSFKIETFNYGIEEADLNSDGFEEYIEESRNYLKDLKKKGKLNFYKIVDFIDEDTNEKSYFIEVKTLRDIKDREDILDELYSFFGERVPDEYKRRVFPSVR